MTETDTNGDTQHSFSRPSMRVVEAVSAAADVEPASLEPPLHDVIDTVALDRLFEPTTNTGTSRRGCVSFGYRDYDVTVHSSGQVDLD